LTVTGEKSEHEPFVLSFGEESDRGKRRRGTGRKVGWAAGKEEEMGWAGRMEESWATWVRARNRPPGERVQGERGMVFLFSFYFENLSSFLLF
jgi:hypothetical protein